MKQKSDRLIDREQADSGWGCGGTDRLIKKETGTTGR